MKAVRNVVLGIVIGAGLMFIAKAGYLDEAGENSRYLNGWCEQHGCDQKY